MPRACLHQQQVAKPYSNMHKHLQTLSHAGVLIGKPRTELPYHVRVLVPCYKESLEILRRTIMAAYDADLPRGCSRTIYLCDDGKDPKKRKWCDTMGPEVQYVSGRKRPTGEMNGKSGNLNNVVAQMYPEVSLTLTEWDLMIMYHTARLSRAAAEFLIEVLSCQHLRMLSDAGLGTSKRRQWQLIVQEEASEPLPEKYAAHMPEGPHWSMCTKHIIRGLSLNRGCFTMQGTPVPGHELLCIFDADQVASKEFFLKTLPLFDGGDDVGMVLSPQVPFFFPLIPQLACPPFPPCPQGPIQSPLQSSMCHKAGNLQRLVSVQHGCQSTKSIVCTCHWP